MRKLNRSKPYGTISGVDPSLPRGARYEQNGMYFNHAGEYLAGEYKPADEQDRLESENEKLKRRIAELEAKEKANQTQPPDEDPEKSDGLNRDEIVAQLKKREIKFHGNSSTESLYQLLQEAIDNEKD